VQTCENLTNEDLKAVYASVRSIPAVKNRVPEPALVEAPGGVKN
jgi:hypothetical protein